MGTTVYIVYIIGVSLFLLFMYDCFLSIVCESFFELREVHLLRRGGGGGGMKMS